MNAMLKSFVSDLRAPIAIALAAFAAFAALGDNITNLTLKASTDKGNPIDYELGETIRFDFRLDGVTNLPVEVANVAPLHVIWTRCHSGIYHKRRNMQKG